MTVNDASASAEVACANGPACPGRTSLKRASRGCEPGSARAGWVRPDRGWEDPMPLSQQERAGTELVDLDTVDAYWRAANYLSAGQIYLLDNPLLAQPLAPEHIKPRLLGHWGTTPGLNFVYAHLNRVIKAMDLDVLFVTGPGHGGPALLANTWLEGSYSEVYPAVPMDARGMARLFRQFSFPGGVPSHVAPEVPGSIHEGGELGYSLAHAFGAE